MKPVNVKPSMSIELNKEKNKESPKFEITDNIRISKYKNIFSKGYISNRSEEVFVIQKDKNTVRCTDLINDLKGEEIFGKFSEK